MAERMLPVPLPSKSPVSVVEPVPPFDTESAVPRFKLPKDAFCAKRFVDDAVVEKKFVEVAFPKMLPPLQVLLLESVEELTMRHVPFTEKQPVVILRPFEKVEVAVLVTLSAEYRVEVLTEKLPMFAIEKIEPGVVEPIPTNPFWVTVSTSVPAPTAVPVAMRKLLSELKLPNAHLLVPPLRKRMTLALPEPASSIIVAASCCLITSGKSGTPVPMPMNPFWLTTNTF